MVKKTKILLVAASVLLLSALWQPAYAQDPLAGNGYSPYSLFGFGDLVRQGTGYNLSMGGIGIGDRISICSIRPPSRRGKPSLS